ncbi:MAG: flavodoxin family protein [Spirochaetes bacterium]|nr:flavodoxin family protein [Spirochaetota bacterium]
MEALRKHNRAEENAMSGENKVLVLLGSPRKKGNSAMLAERIVRGARSAGAAVETVFLHGMTIAPCRSCYACQRPRSKGCAIDDDMQGVYRKMLQSPAWVIASPVYWFSMSAQTKIWMDRCFALGAYAKNPFHGRRIALAMSYGGEDPFDSGCVNALRTFQDAYRYVGAEMVGMVYGSATEAGEIASNKPLLREAEDLGKRLVCGL